ncbi:polysaccharide deacetylase family protein [Streptomyces atratus]|uniref:polysaccharide deacetylase family protein n=1 Tax=Streptomyces atratus TaxID=1893 RepID=UPI0036CD918E
MLRCRSCTPAPLLRDMAAAGHEIGIHGWHHRPLPLRGPKATFGEPRRARGFVADVTGAMPCLFRPPYGAMSTAAPPATLSQGPAPVLRTTWGRDRTRQATAESVHRTVTARLSGGDTIPLHDSDVTSAPGACVRTPLAERSRTGSVRPYRPSRPVRHPMRQGLMHEPR